MRKIGIAVTTWNRYQQTVDSFAKILDDERVESVLIMDDASTDGSLHRLRIYFEEDLKVLVDGNVKNLDCYFNKYEAVRRSKNEWVCLWDSDNIFDKSYLDVIYAIPEWDSKTIYQPSYAKPHFDFRNYEGLTLTKENVSQFVDTHLMTALNAMNFFINKLEYLRVWDGSVDPLTSDSIYFSYCWLKAGNKIHITPNLTYDHFIDPNENGHYQQNQHRTVEFHESLMQKIRELR